MQALAMGPVKRDLGVNVPGWLVAGATPEHVRGFMSDRDFAQLVNWRFTHLRVPLDASLLGTTAGWQALDVAVTLCGHFGLGLMLALRWPDPAQLFSTPESWRAIVECWVSIATRYRGSGSSILFDLLDAPAIPDDLPAEVLSSLGAARVPPAALKRGLPPGSTAGRAWTALATRLTAAIRDVDDRSTLVVQSVGGRPEAFAHLRPTRDARTWYAFQCFVPEGLALRGEGMYPGEIDGERWDRERLKRLIEPAVEFGRVYEAPIYAGAFGATDAAPRQSRLTWVRSLLWLYRNSGIGWAYWAFRDPHFGLIADGTPDYDLLGVLQSE
jgi:hypothetical protein